jgi:hypothetical protein
MCIMSNRSAALTEGFCHMHMLGQFISVPLLQHSHCIFLNDPVIANLTYATYAVKASVKGCDCYLAL